MITDADSDIIVLTDAMIAEFMSDAQGEFFVGVRFTLRGKVYTYIAPPSAHVGSRVLVPANAFCSEPQVVTVVTLNPPVRPGIAIVRVLEVLS